MTSGAPPVSTPTAAGGVPAGPSSQGPAPATAAPGPAMQPKQAPSDIIWDNPQQQPAEWHSLKAFGRGMVGGYLSSVDDAPQSEIDRVYKNLHIEDPGPHSTSDKVLEFAGGLATPAPGGIGKGASLAASRAADVAAGGRTLGQQTGSTAIQALERTVARLPGGGSLAEAIRSQNTRLGDTTEDIVQRLSGGADTSATGAGGMLDSQLKLAAARMKGEAGTHYDAVEKLLPPNTQVGVKSTIQTLKELTTPVQGAQHTSGLLIDKDIAGIAQGLERDLANSPMQSMPYDVLKQLRTQVGGKIDWGPFSTDPKNGALKRLYSSLTADMMNGAAAVSPEAAAAVRQANAAYAVSKQSQQVLQSVINKAGGPEKVFASLMSGTREGASTLVQVLSAIDEPSRQLLAASALQRMGRATPGVQNAAGELFSADTFLTNWNRMSPQAREVLFGQLPMQYSVSISQLSANVEALKAYAKIMPNTSNTAQVAMWGGEVGGALMALMTGHFETAAAIAGTVAGTKVLSASLTNPQTAKWFAQQTGRIVASSAYATGALEAAEHRKIGKQALQETFTADDFAPSYPSTLQ